MIVRKTSFIATLIVFPLAFAVAAQDRQPNVVMIVVDDMRYDEFGAGGHQYLRTPSIDGLSEEGVVFTNAYHVNPLCSPNRASLLTGQYPSRHGITDNTSRSRASHNLDLFAVQLQTAGYRTAHVGKWHMGNDPTPRPGYDYWVSFAGQGRTVDPELFEAGRIRRVDGYITDILTDRAITFIEQPHDRPFFLYLGHKAVHPDLTQLDDGTVDLSRGSRFIPASRHRGKYAGRTLERAPSFGFPDAQATGKPVLKRALETKASAAVRETFGAILDEGTSDETVQRRAEMMLAIDESTGRIMRSLEAAGLLDNTFIVFTSDNGYFFGEHGLSIERRLPYEEALKSPLLVRHPELAEKAAQIDGLVLSIDIAPTILDIAGAEIPETVQGRSLVPLLNGETDEIRDSAYMEYYSHENPMPWTVDLDYRVVRKGKYKYIYWLRFPGDAELYDLNADPHELNNLIGDPDLAATVDGLHLEMQKHVIDAFGL